MTEKKITKREMFAKIKEAVSDNAEMVTFIDHEVELLTRKNTTRNGKPTALQKVNEEIKASIMNELDSGEKYTIADLIKVIPNPTDTDFTTSKMSALVRQLKEAGLVSREQIKGRAYFFKA